MGFLGLCLSAGSTGGEVGLGQVQLDLIMMLIYNDVDDGKVKLDLIMVMMMMMLMMIYIL